MHIFNTISFFSLKKPITKLTYLFLLFFFSNTALYAACSPFKGVATINEIDQTGSSSRFVEIKLLDSLFIGDLYKTWTISICNSDNECTGTISYANSDATNSPWIVVKHPVVPYRAASNSEPYLDMKNGFDIILKDESGLTIDYFSVENYTAQQDAACTPAFDWQWDRASAGLNNNYNTDNLRRSPDGNGDWGSPGTGNSGGDSEITTNDKDPDGNTAPVITVESVTVNEGMNATFTFSLPTGITKNYEIKIDYNTQGGTAVSPTDYTHTSGTVTLPANTNSITVDVPTTSGSPSGLTYFIFYLSNPVNATIANNYPTGTIIPTTSSATAEWYMDEASWSNSINEVTDSSANTNHGTPKNNVNTTKNYKVLCSAGSFDGSNDYIEIPHHSSLVGSDKLTYSAWIRPDSWSGSIRQIMSKSVHGGGAGRAQMGIFSENGNFVGRAETAAGRYEVFTPLPPLSTRWIHVTLTFNGTSLVIYIDGKVAPSVSITKPSIKTFGATTLKSNTDPLMISKRVGSNQYYFDGYIDEVVVFKEALPASFIKLMNSNYLAGLNWDGKARSCPGSLHHIEFVHDTSALTCNPEQVTVKACANADCSSLATTSTTVGLSPTGWIDGDSKTFTGSANYKLQHTTAETVTLSTTSVSPAPSNALVCKTSGGTVIDPCTMTFHDSGFIFDITTQTSCAISSDIKISAVRKNPTTEQCTPFFEDKDVNLKIWNAYSSPATGTKKSTLNYSGTDYVLDTSSPATSNVTMKFDANGQSTFKITYDDAGRLDLNATYTGSAATSDVGLSMSGNKEYVTKPAKFYVYSDDTNASCVSGDPTQPDCRTAFRKTGENFNLKIRAACADNTVTPNFQLNGITMASNLVAPSSAGSVNANLGVTSFNTIAADNGEHTISAQNVDQVGIFTFTAALPATGYLGETIIGTTALNTSANIGRFTPDHFDTLVTHGCNGGGNFTYSGQPFTVTATARNHNNLNMVNYREGFAGVTLTDAAPAATPLGTFTNNTIPAANFTSTGTGSGSQTNLAYTFTNKQTIPETLEIRTIDLNKTSATTDDINSSGFTEGTTTIRSGRTQVENSYGSELVDMAVTAQIEYYTTNGFELSTSDACSAVTATLTDVGTDPITIGDGSGATQTCIRDDDGESGTYNCSDASVLPGPVAAQFESPAIAGNFNLFLKAPGADNTGDIKITLTSPIWLKYDWDGDGTHDDDPTGIASFGLYRGDDRIIYWREIF